VPCAKPTTHSQWAAKQFTKGASTVRGEHRGCGPQSVQRKSPASACAGVKDR